MATIDNYAAQAEASEVPVMDSTTRRLLEKVNLWLDHGAGAVDLKVQKYRLTPAFDPGNAAQAEISYIINEGTYNKLVNSLNTTKDYIVAEYGETALNIVKRRLEDLADLFNKSGLEAKVNFSFSKQEIIVKRKK